MAGREETMSTVSDISFHKTRDPETINYGAVSSNLAGCGPETFYLTTAISYTNGYPHIGHAYEFMTSDAIVRFKRVLGYDTYFLTGSDEHGQKVANSAAAAGRTPLEHCDVFVEAFKALDQRLAMSYSNYIRTTDAFHERASQKLWKRCHESGDIYLSNYEGWYNEREETFIPDAEAAQSNYLDPSSGVPLKRVVEESYFFRMSKYEEFIIEFIENNPSFVQPEQYRNSILARLKKEGLRDLSISRTSFTWGVPVPEGFDQRHVMYVWFDALTNYLAGVFGMEPDHELAKYWPCDVHIVGKDIIWFHCVIWPCMLKSAGVPIHKSVFSHGFVNAADGRKMSKSFNNTIDPHDMLNKYHVDSLRYYCIASTTYGHDMNFNEATLITMHNSELADILGNLVHRALNLCMKYCEGVIPDTVHDAAFALPFDIEELDREIRVDLQSYSIHLAIFKAMEAARATNRYLTEAEPWKMKGENECRRPAIVRTTLEAIYAMMHYLAPVIPIAAGNVFQKLNTLPVITRLLRRDFYNLLPGTAVSVGDILFTKLEEVKSEVVESLEALEISKKPSKGSAPKPSKKTGSEAEPEDPNQSGFSKMDIRVGRIVRVWNHETADRLFCEEIDIGESEPRTVASGLREHYTLEEMSNRLVVVVCNLKEAKMQGFLSTAMVLAAKGTDTEGRPKVELLEPPPDSLIGERIVAMDCPGGPALPAARVKKLKVWEEVVPDLRLDAERRATWQGHQLVSSAGPCRSATLTNAPLG